VSDTIMSASIDKLAGALLSAQSEMGNASKDSKNPFFKSKYADLNAVREASHPALNKYGITVLQPMVQKGDKSYVRTMLLHASGQYLASDTEVVCAKQNDPQSYGSAVSYARRYGLQALVSLGAEDDDAEAGMGRSKPTAVAATKAPTVIPVTEVTVETPKKPSKFERKAVMASTGDDI